MGHYASELFPRGYDVEMREHYEREAKRQKEESERNAARSLYERKLMRGLSGEELQQEVLKTRISTMVERYYRITSHIPASLTLHLKDEESWNVYGYLSDSGGSGLFLNRTSGGYWHDEHESFELEIDKGVASARHRERGLMDMSFSKNSEREIKPAEELFERLIKPLEQKLGLSPLK